MEDTAINRNMDAEYLKKRFNPEGSLLRRQQHRMTEMLLFIDKVCKKHGIPYWLSSGTLLGCVRHGGYIPWDDDLDIEMLRKDYMRLMEVLPKELPENYALQTHDTDPNYIFAYAKLRDKKSYLEETNHYDRIFKYRGIYIDIFPFEKSPLLLHWISCRAHGFIYKVLNNRRNTDEVAIRKVNRIFRFNEKVTFPLLRALSAFYPSKLVRYSFGVPYSDTRRMEDIFPLTTAKFEGYDMPVPRDCHAYLSRKFGNYMQLPNIDELHLHVYKMEIED